MAIQTNYLARLHAARAQAIREAKSTLGDGAVGVRLTLEDDSDTVGMLLGAMKEVRLDRPAPSAIERLLEAWEMARVTRKDEDDASYNRVGNDANLRRRNERGGDDRRIWRRDR